MVLYMRKVQGATSVASKNASIAVRKAIGNSLASSPQTSSNRSRVTYQSTQAGPHVLREEISIALPSDADPKPVMVSCNNPLKNKRVWICPECQKALSSKRSYLEHINIHTDSRPFACEDCEYAAASQMTLRRHRLRNHTARNEWGYRCPYCKEVYMEPASYKQHVQTKHEGRSATYGCPHEGCDFTTKSFQNFHQHLVKHMNADTSTSTPMRYDLSEESLFRYLVDDEFGSGFRQKRVLLNRHSTIVAPSTSPYDIIETNEFPPEDAVNSQEFIYDEYVEDQQTYHQTVRRQPKRQVRLRPTREQFEEMEREENLYESNSYETEEQPIFEMRRGIRQFEPKEKVKKSTTANTYNLHCNGMQDIELD